jgi:hypothetical protein
MSKEKMVITIVVVGWFLATAAVFLIYNMN